MPTISVDILAVERHSCSVNGNPSYNLIVRHDSGEVTTLRTSTDAGCAYAATGFRPSHRNGYAPVPAVLTLTRAGRVNGIDHA